LYIQILFLLMIRSRRPKLGCMSGRALVSLLTDETLPHFQSLSDLKRATAIFLHSSVSMWNPTLGLAPLITPSART
jgi:hypothetical protein